MKNRIFNTILFLFFLLTLMTGCSEETNRIKKAVLSYNTQLSQAYQDGNIETVKALCSKEQEGIVDNRIRDLNRNNIQLATTLLQFQFTEIQMSSPDKAIITTDESWNFKYSDLHTGGVMTELSPYYTGSYVLTKQDGKWLVDRVEVQPKDTVIEKTSAPGPFKETTPGSKLSEEEQIKSTLMTYLVLLEDGYRNQNMTPLLHSATSKRAQKSYYHMSSIGEAHMKMDPQLLDIKVRSIHLLSENKAVIKAHEHWRYSYHHAATGEKAYENSIYYDLTYTLIKEEGNGRWLVDDIIIDQTREESGEGALPFYIRPADHPQGRP